MRTDTIFYCLFELAPDTLFVLLGKPADAAKELAARYQYQAIEFKETAHRADGVFLPRDPAAPVYFLEVQCYSRASIFADLLAKAFTYLKQNDPGQDFLGVVLFESRSMEPKEIAPYRHLLENGQILRFYLDEMGDPTNAPLGFAIMRLVAKSEAEAPAVARELIGRAKAEVSDVAYRQNLVELIEKVIVAKLSNLTREEIQAMLHVQDLRETRFYQEAKEDGVKEGKTEGRIEGKAEGKAEGRIEGKAEGQKEAFAIARLAARKMSAEQIAAKLNLDVEAVRQALAALSTPDPS